MGAILGALVSISIASTAWAERHPIKPSDFRPLTELPWKKSDASLEKALRAIYLETNGTVRLQVRDAYLRLIPVEILGRAFDLFLELERTRSPDALVSAFISIWAERDPEGCWERVEKLFHLVGIEWGALGYDAWDHAITVQDRRAIQAAGFWLSRETLKGFPLAVEKSKAPEADRVRLMKAFADTWFAAFKTWPGYAPGQGRAESLSASGDLAGQIVHMLELPPIVELPQHVQMEKPDAAAAYDVALRKMVQANPKAASEIIKKGRADCLKNSREKNWGIEVPSTELLMIWASGDLAGMIRWVEKLDAGEAALAQKVKGFLMSRVNAKTRNRWLAEARKTEGAESDLLQPWAEWDPEPALNAAAEAGQAVDIRWMGVAAGFGPWMGQPSTAGFGLDVITRFDFSKFGRRDPFAENGYNLGELWDDVDPGAAARFHLDYLLRTGYAPREGLITFFRGGKIYNGQDGMIDRCFCALRVWAVVQPEEMKAWIATIKDEEMQKALTWLLNNPWGHEPEQPLEK